MKRVILTLSGRQAVRKTAVVKELLQGSLYGCKHYGLLYGYCHQEDEYK